ncbi:MAG: AAA family ATPase [Pirellulaceae bacterium]|nr:AAA family ATPase [Pirellulaceae bacterium]
MSATQGCNDDKAVVESFKEALKQRVGLDIFQAWFASGVEFRVTFDAAAPAPSADSQDTSSSNPPPQLSAAAAGQVVVEVQRQFALDRLRRNFVRELRGAAMQVCGIAMEIDLVLAPQPQQVELPLGQESENRSGVTSSAALPTASPVAEKKSRKSRAPQRNKRKTKSLSTLVKHRKGSSDVGLNQPSLPQFAGQQDVPTGSGIQAVCQPDRVGQNEPSCQPESDTQIATVGSDSGDTELGSVPAREASSTRRQTLETFVAGKCNQLARTAAQLVCETPSAASPMFLAGPPGVGKTHLLLAIADQLRRRQRMRRVIHLSAEKFTNDFVHCLSGHTLTSFRARYRDVDALLVDDVQFLSAKKATLREMLYTVEWLTDRGKTLVFAGSHTPHEISGLTPELSGRMSAGLVCSMQSLDAATRESILRTEIEQRCAFAWPEEMVHEINVSLAGDGRRIHGIVNLVGALQRMYGRMPTMDEIRQFGGDQLRSNKPVVTLMTIERAVAQTFQLQSETLRSKSQARTATEPRMLAMYLSRELTSSAFAEIGRFYGGRSHSAAILAIRRVESWLASGKSVGRGPAALSARDALDRVESLLRSG